MLLLDVRASGRTVGLLQGPGASLCCFPWESVRPCQGGAFPPDPGLSLLAASPSSHAPSWLLAA